MEGSSLVRYFQLKEGSTQYNLKVKLENLFKHDNTKVKIPKNLIAETYGYNFNDKKQTVIKHIENYSIKKSSEIWASRNLKIPLKSIDELFIIASIIEKETSKNSEKQTIAGVFYNRMRTNMKLQSDPTVIYALSKGKEFNRQLTRRDTKYKSKFNTYHVKGLPPSPICFPGISSIYAAANPKYSKYFYFVANRKGGHFFSKDYKSHLEKIKLLKNNAK